MIFTLETMLKDFRIAIRFPKSKFKDNITTYEWEYIGIRVKWENIKNVIERGPDSWCSRWLVRRVLLCSGIDRRWVSSWCWSCYRWLRVYSWVSSLAVKTMTQSRLPGPTDRSADRERSSSTYWMTLSELSLPLTSLEPFPIAAAAAAAVAEAIVEPTSCPSLSHVSAKTSNI